MLFRRRQTIAADFSDVMIGVREYQTAPKGQEKAPLQTFSWTSFVL